jgi:predicted nucleic acid-binding protein
MTDTPSDFSVYVDANPIVYALEGPEELALALKKLFSAFRQKRILAATSELTLAEVLLKRKIPDRHFLDLLVWGGIFDLRPVTREILVETAQYRRTVAVKQPDGRLSIPRLPDAIHVVTAFQAGCRFFLSADVRIKLPDTMDMVQANVDGIERLIREIA